MMPPTCNQQAPVPPPSYHRREVQAQAQRARALHINALTFIEVLHLLAFCRLAVQVAHQRCPPPLPKGAGGRAQTYREESLLLIALLKTLWRLSRPGMCMSGCKVGLPWLWPVVCPSLQMASRAFPALPNCANAGKRQKRLLLRPSLYSRFGVLCVVV
jgi:hypothetical protein